jgi:hypothetical protein
LGAGRVERQTVEATDTAMHDDDDDEDDDEIANAPGRVGGQAASDQRREAAW